jgi:hypothetical protein
MTKITPDPEYDLIAPLPGSLEAKAPKRGSQCGECGVKFEYGQTYGYSCGSYRCPMGVGPAGRM